ncbi:uncharacterized protein Z518_00212 [Rhinocladiella mackenziei CBS 650.93]|uniref:Conserved oligomeric Golgi complex subunit 1 n=1 Tax=Rhinocladiella mackenziei CBS 650.93 TaxID=1442369 RepID=A0A0D2ISZ6_9EURO|nr:uncharacterized protein Z518_00212 [Rhinocladiella mackenziei CBS 650.93]KIX09134.1 hypothetical protein Z518_00212 [Rhinocladiella mackenziei CBS 650.93]
MDPGTTITTWQQAFEEYRIPTTRTIEKQLRSSAARDKEKLRALVGGSYRELLATAEAIVILDTKTKTTEDRLSSIAHECRPPQQDASYRPPPPGKATLAQFRLLQRCCTTSAASLRTRNLLQCAQLIVVSRLLLKSLSDQEVLAKGREFLRNRISTLRRQLLGEVDAELVNPIVTLSDLLDSICSYCLVTSVSSEDALAHLCQLRLEKLRRQLNVARQASMIYEALQYQLASLQMFKALTGRPITEAIHNLQKRPILVDPTIRDLELLDLDRTWPLIPTEIQSFVPYFKRSGPTADETNAKLEAWSQDACGALTGAMKNHLTELNDITTILELRKDLYTILLRSYFSTPAGAEIQKQVRHVLNERISAICHSEGSQLMEITKSILQGISINRPNKKSLWDPDIAQSSLSNGAGNFIKQVKIHHAGLSGALSKATKALDSWISSARMIQSQIDHLAKIRWRDIIEEPEEEYEEDASDLIQTLSTRDPDSYHKSLQEAVQKAISNYETSMTRAASELVDSNEVDVAPNFREAVTLLRSIRLSTVSLQQAFPHGTSFTQLTDIVPQLHEVVAREVSRRLFEVMEERKERSLNWDMTALPEPMPSPKAFSTLRRMCQIMLEIGGTDLWSPPAVDVVKKTVTRRIFDAEHQRWYVENELDAAYLKAALGYDTEESASNPSEAGRAGVEYWTRTKLLFGVLA